MHPYGSGHFCNSDTPSLCCRWWKKDSFHPSDNHLLFHAVFERKTRHGERVEKSNYTTVDLLMRLLGTGNKSRSFPMSWHVAQVPVVKEVQDEWSGLMSLNTTRFLWSCQLIFKLLWKAKKKNEKSARGLVQLDQLSLLTRSLLFSKSGHEATRKDVGSHLDMIRYIICDHMIKAHAPGLNITLNYNTSFTKRIYPGTHFRNTQLLQFWLGPTQLYLVNACFL